MCDSGNVSHCDPHHSHSDESKWLEVKVIEAKDLPLTTFKRQPDVFVEIIASNVQYRTPVIKGAIHPNWNSNLIILTPSESSNVSFSVFHEGILQRKCLGKVATSVGELLERQRHKAESDVILSLVDKRGNLTGSILTVRVAEHNASAVVSALGQARDSNQGLEAPVTDGQETTLDLTNLVFGHEMEPVFDSLLKKLEVILQAGEELAKLHPYVNFAWQILSAGLKLIRGQKRRDEMILDLLRTMEETYSFVAWVDKLKANLVLQDVAQQILKQTIECGFFILEYTRDKSGQRFFVQPLSGTNEMIKKFRDEFARLRKNFDSGVDLSTALLLARTTSTIDAIRYDQVLTKLNPLHMDEYDRPICLPKTRSDAVKFITQWISNESNDGKRVLWLYGLAGSGKSTLSTTIAGILRDLQRLGAFFFFNRDIPERNAATLIRTLAHQLALFDPQIGAEMSHVIESNPNIAATPLDFQFANLLSEKAMSPVNWSRGTVVLIVDALDEAGREKDRRTLLHALSNGFRVLPPFLRIIITSREEADIERTLASHQFVESYNIDNDSSATMQDILEFLRHRLAEIRLTNRYLPFESDWPGDNRISALGNCADGSFIWASTACLYIDSHDPRLRLDELTTQSSAHPSSISFTNLDRLYHTGLSSAGSWTDHAFCSDSRDILGAILCARIPLSCVAIDSLLTLPRPCLQSISRLRCFLRGSETEAIRVLHPSFHDYVTSRCQGEAWFIDLEQHNEKLAFHCIELLKRNLRENIRGLTLPEPVKKEILPEALSYACKFWVEHFSHISRVTDIIGDQILQFLEIHLLHWIEAMALLKSHGRTIHLLQDLLDWLGVSLPAHHALRLFVYDAHRFAQYFANTINAHPLLVYVTALPFTPLDTSIYRKFYRDGLPKVICGVEKSWPPLLRVLRGHETYVRSVSFSQDGTKIVSGSSDRTIRVWDVSTGAEMLPPLRGHSDWVRSVAFLHDGSKIVSGSDDKTIRVWNASTGAEVLPPLLGHDDVVRSVKFSHDGTKIISGSSDCTIRIWDAITGTEILPVLRGHEDYVRSVAISLDGSKIVSGSSDRTVRVWNAITHTEMLPPLRGHEDNVMSVELSHDGTTIVSGSSDNTIRIWDANTGANILPPLRGHDDYIQSIAISSDGLKIVSGSDDRTVRVWDSRTGSEILPPLQGHTDYILSVAFSSQGTKIVSSSDDKTVRIWDARGDATTIPPLEGHDDYVLSMAVSDDGSKIVSGSADNTIRIWDVSTGTATLPPLRGHNDYVWSVAFSADGSKIVSGSSDKTIRIWDAKTGAELLPPLRGHENFVRSVSFSRDGSRIVSGSSDKTVRLWNADTGVEMISPLQGHNEAIRTVSFSNDGSQIVSGSEDQTVRIWDAKTGVTKLPPFRGHTDVVRSVAFSPNDVQIASGSDDKSIRVWDASSGLEILPPLLGHTDSVLSVTFSCEGLKIISGSDDNTVRVWDTSSSAVNLQNPTSDQRQHNEVSSSMSGYPIISLSQGGWFTNEDTGGCLGKLQIGTLEYFWRAQRSFYVGWTPQHKLIILTFPV